VPTKVCAKCEQTLPLESFGENKRYSDGRQSYCRPCFSEYMRDKRNPGWRATEADYRALAAMGQRRCRKCKGVFPATTEHFYASAKCVGGIQWECKECYGSRVRTGKLSRLYGMTDADFSAMLADQGGGCAINPQHDMGGSNWHIDHDHDTGRVRGVLCKHCNTALGYARDDPATLRALADYLERALA
jgi:hypothetical protein